MFFHLKKYLTAKSVVSTLGVYIMMEKMQKKKKLLGPGESNW